MITLWESFEYAEESNQQFTFVKVHFDKPYDQIEWDFIFQSLQDIGFGNKFIKYIHALFGNAFAKVAINGEVTECITLKKFISQDCPVAPLLFAICSDALEWLIKEAIDNGKVKGIHIPGAANLPYLQ
ncbi:hypothetical protein L7F22_029125 [Adiantum nelumboides]|nr:hypothetical protein [Adiantum nelumboides]